MTEPSIRRLIYKYPMGMGELGGKVIVKLPKNSVRLKIGLLDGIKLWASVDILSIEEEQLVFIGVYTGEKIDSNWIYLETITFILFDKYVKQFHY